MSAAASSASASAPSAPSAVPQRAFAVALLDPLAALPLGLRSWNGSDPAHRFAVHRNNVLASLIEALADTLPVTRQLVGADFFAAMAASFVRAAPPRSPVLAHYGAEMPAFIESFALAAALPYLADVARLELARVRACHAADAPLLARAVLAEHARDPLSLAGARLDFQPSAGVLSSPFAIVALWAAHQGLLDIFAVDPMRPQSALVLRRNDEVMVFAIDIGTAACCRALMAGATLAEASAQAGAVDPGFDLGACLGLLVREAALSAWHRPGVAASP